MKQMLCLVAALIFCACAALAQNDVSAVTERADAAFSNKDYSSALDAYLLAAGMDGGAGHHSAAALIRASECCYYLDRYEQGMRLAEPLLSMRLTDDDMKAAAENYSVNALMYGLCMLADNPSEYLRVRAILEKVVPHAAGDVLKVTEKRLQTTYILEGRTLAGAGSREDARRAYRRGYLLSDDSVQRLKILYALAELDDDTPAALTTRYDSLLAMARRCGNDEFQFKALMKQRRICRTINDMERYACLGTSLDSLMSVTADDDIRAQYYMEVGNEYLDYNDFAMAEFYFRRFRDDFEKTGSTNYYSSMRSLRQAQGRYAEALEYSGWLIRWYAGHFGTGDYRRYIVYLIESQLHAENHDSLSFERACDTLRSAYRLMPDEYNRSLVYNFIGSGYSKLGSHEKALRNFLLADSVLALKYGFDMDMRRSVMKLAAGEYKELGRYDDACAVYERCAAVEADIYGKGSMQYARLLMFIANAEQYRGNSTRAARLYRDADAIFCDILRRELRYVPSAGRASFINTLARQMWRMSAMSLWYADTDRSFLRDSYDTVITLKSLLFESDRSMYNTLQKRGTAQDVDDFVRLSLLRTRHNELARDFEKNEQLIKETDMEMRLLDDRLTRKSEAYKEYTSFLDTDYDDVRRRLGRRDVLFDFVDYEQRDGSRRYVAYVVRKNFDTPVLVDMFTQADIDSLTLGGKNMDVLCRQDLSGRVTDMLWHKLEKYARRGGRVYYVPSGSLYQVSLESLPLPDGTLLGEHYRFARLSSARSVVSGFSPLEGKRTAVLYGGLDYDADPAAMRRSRSRGGSLPVMRNASTGSTSFAYLPETLSETLDVGGMLLSGGYEVTSYTGSEGTEESFVGLHNHSPQILHIATHGFFHTPEEAPRYKYLKDSPDVMMLSGLILSGGNAAWTGRQMPAGTLGGVVTSANISCLDLSATQLVVLSACQSGKGSTTVEGLLGLQMAFKKTGARTLVMTLWDVSDMVTRRFMTTFYDNLINHRCDRREAFEKARRTIRDIYPEPLYWAGFVMVD